jgi:hypothetical protein
MAVSGRGEEAYVLDDFRFQQPLTCVVQNCTGVLIQRAMLRPAAVTHAGLQHAWRGRLCRSIG